MKEKVKESAETHPRNLAETAEILRKRFASVRVETSMTDNDTALSVRFVGDIANLQERRILVNNLAESLPQALSILGIEPDKSGEEATSSNNAS